MREKTVQHRTVVEWPVKGRLKWRAPLPRPQYKDKDQLRDQRSQGPWYWPPFAPWVQGGAGVGWVCSGGDNLAPGPLCSVAGDPDRHWGWLLCPSSVPAAAGRGLRPRVFSAHGPPPQLQVQDSVMGRRPMPHCWRCVYPDRRRAPSSSHSYNLARSCADSDRRSGVNQARGSPFRHTGCTTQSICGLVRPHGAFAATCEVLCDHTTRAHAATAVLSDCLRFCMSRGMCDLVLCGPSAGQPRRKNGLPHPGREPRGCLHAGGEKRGHLAAPCRQTKGGGSREGPFASDIGSLQPRAGRADTWSARFHCIRRQARRAT
jgi:hypothetical protein